MSLLTVHKTEKVGPKLINHIQTLMCLFLLQLKSFNFSWQGKKYDKIRITLINGENLRYCYHPEVNLFLLLHHCNMPLHYPLQYN